MIRWLAIRMEVISLNGSPSAENIRDKIKINVEEKK
jgi:hypothetical protein